MKNGMRKIGISFLVAAATIADAWYIQVRIDNDGWFIPKAVHGEGGVYTMGIFLSAAVVHMWLASEMWRVRMNVLVFTIFERISYVLMTLCMLIIYLPTWAWTKVLNNQH
jgi:hypothetical protein